MFYKADSVFSDRDSFILYNITELVLIFDDIIKSLNRSLHFIYNVLEQKKQTSTEFKITLAIIELVCQETRVKFKNIDFQTKADFVCYCRQLE